MISRHDHDAAAVIQAIRVCMARKRVHSRSLHEESSQRAAAQSARLPLTTLSPIVSESATTGCSSSPPSSDRLKLWHFVEQVELGCFDDVCPKQARLPRHAGHAFFGMLCAAMSYIRALFTVGE
jgi:hypothetical protein